MGDRPPGILWLDGMEDGEFARSDRGRRVIDDGCRSRIVPTTRSPVPPTRPTLYGAYSDLGTDGVSDIDDAIVNPDGIDVIDDEDSIATLNLDGVTSGE